MYLGTVTVLEKRYLNCWPPRSVVVRATKHVYRCEHCGETYRFPEPATEPFYCHSEPCSAVKLVSIEPAEAAREVVTV